MQLDLTELERRLWDAADELRANSALKASEYGGPVLGLIFLRFADTKFTAARDRIEAKGSARRTIGPGNYHAERVIYLSEVARFSHLLSLPESADLGKAINDAMRAVEADNSHLAGVLPKSLRVDLEYDARVAAAPHQRLHEGSRRRCLRPHLRVLPREVRGRRGTGRRRVLHAPVDRPAHRGDH